MTNKDLCNMVNSIIKESGVTKVHIAKKLGVSRQAVDAMLSKKQFTIEDADKLLNIVGYKIEDIKIKKL